MTMSERFLTMLAEDGGVLRLGQHAYMAQRTGMDALVVAEAARIALRKGLVRLEKRDGWFHYVLA